MSRPRPLARSELSRFLKFSVVGAVGFVIDIGIFNLLHVRAGWQEIPSEVVSFSVAVTSNFIWNRYWTYPDSRSKPIRQQAGQFGLVSVAGLVIRTVAFAFLLAPCTRLANAILGLPAAAGLPVTAAWLGANLTLGMVILIVLFWNFLANRLWTYADVDRAPAGPSARAADGPPV
ncbi:MAG TPA: GtrA family protein [Anaerolineales bacterium]|nr:GtrA family protein [Anaerolineales bacterium]